MIQENTTDIARGQLTTFNNPESSVEWAFYENSYTRIQGFVDVYIDLSPGYETDVDVMLIMGGKTGIGRGRYNVLSSVEIFDPSDPSLNCILPNMTKVRDQHVAVGFTVCGDKRYSGKKCETLDGQTGQWTESHKLQQNRNDHVMWQSPSKGLMLLGGELSSNTVETLQDDGSSVELDWKLKTRT